MTDTSAAVIGGVDTHKDSHAVAALTETGRFLGPDSLPPHPTAIRSF